MSPGPNLAPPLARKVTPPTASPSSGRCLANPRAGDAESKVMVESPRDAAPNASRLSRCSTADCAAPPAASQSAAEATSAYSPTLMRELLLKVAYSCVCSRGAEGGAPPPSKGQRRGETTRRPGPARTAADSGLLLYG